MVGTAAAMGAEGEREVTEEVEVCDAASLSYCCTACILDLGLTIDWQEEVAEAAVIMVQEVEVEEAWDVVTQVCLQALLYSHSGCTLSTS